MTTNIMSKKWKRIEINVSYITDSINGKKPPITFNLSENKVTGNSSCNYLNTIWEIDSNNFKLNELVSSRMVCLGEGQAVFQDIKNREQIQH